MLAGFVGIAQILVLCNSAINANDTFDKAVVEGREPLLRGVPNRIIRLAGKASDVTTFTMKEDGLHLVPIVEEPGNEFTEELRDAVGGSLPYPV